MNPILFYIMWCSIVLGTLTNAGEIVYPKSRAASDTERVRPQ